MNTKTIFLLAFSCLYIAACYNGALPNSSSTTQNSQSSMEYFSDQINPKALSPLPKCTPNVVDTSKISARIAYTPECNSDSPTLKQPEKDNLVSLAVALLRKKANGEFIRYCSGIPLKYDSTSGIGFVATAAHCVVGAKYKQPDKAIQEDNVYIFNQNAQWIYQGHDSAQASSTIGPTARITEVYIPKSYCLHNEMVYIDDLYRCADFTQQIADIAILKIKTEAGKTLKIFPDLQLADKNLLPKTKITALGYGINNFGEYSRNTKLFFVTYQFFAKDNFSGINSINTMLNGYFSEIDNKFYSIICMADSGGGDFYWDSISNKLFLVGIHSYGPIPCGVSNRNYSAAFDTSTDVLPLHGWIENIINTDTLRNSCIDSPDYICKNQY